MNNGSIAMGLSQLHELVAVGNDSRDQLLQTSRMLTDELNEILTFVNVTALNPKVVELKGKVGELTDLVVKNFEYLNNFFNTQLTRYGQLSEELGQVAGNLNSSIQ